MADEEDYGNWDDEGFEAPEVNVVRKEAEPVDLTLLDAKKREEEEAKRRAEEAAKPKAAPKLEGGGGSSSSSSSSAFDSSNMTEAQREEAQRRAEAASTQEMVGGLVTASRCSEWVPKLIVASVADMEQMGKALAERIHSTFPAGTDALKFYTAMLSVAEQKMGQIDLTTVKKRVEVAVNHAKEREAEQRKRANATGKKKAPVAKMGGATDSYEDEYDGADYYGSATPGATAGGAAEESSTPFTKPVYKEEESFM